MILGVVQARTSSTRLPGKVLMPILGRPMLAHQIDRLRRATRLDRLLVATSVDASDDDLASLCADLRLDCYRGSLEDVLDRFYQAAAPLQPTHVIRLTGDCPLADPQLVDEIVDAHVAGGFDYTSNALERTYPDGLDVEVLRMDCLAQAWREARLPSEREHVTPFINQHPERFALGHVRDAADRSALRWSVDEPEDFAFVRVVYERLLPTNPTFSTRDVLELLAREPELCAGNAHIPINEGLVKSRAEDERFLEEDHPRDA